LAAEEVLISGEASDALKLIPNMLEAFNHAWRATVGYGESRQVYDVRKVWRHGQPE
jgi:hypothetical protein